MRENGDFCNDVRIRIGFKTRVELEVMRTKSGNAMTIQNTFSAPHISTVLLSSTTVIRKFGVCIKRLNKFPFSRLLQPTKKGFFSAVKINNHAFFIENEY